MMRGLIHKALLCAFVGMLAMPAIAQFGAPIRPQVPLPEGPMRSVLLKNCVACHGIDDYAYFALDGAGWEELLEQKHQGVQVNKLSTGDHELLMGYLVENFGPENNPFPRRYIPPEIDTYWEDPRGLAELETVCTECHELDRVYEARHSLGAWRTIVLDMRQRGADLPDDVEMEQLVEWLSRVQSANLFE